MHANEHQQHLPIAGHIWSPGIASSLNIGDVARLRYRYFAEGGIFRPMPIQGALAPYLGVTGFRNDSYAHVEADLDLEGIRKIFICPADEQPAKGRTNQDSYGWFGPMGYNSYAFNDAALGFEDISPSYGRARGNLKRITSPSQVFFLADGLPRPSDGLLTIFERAPDLTLYNAFMIDRAFASLDQNRHQKKVNVCFLDGRAETLVIPDTLNLAYLSTSK